MSDQSCGQEMCTCTLSLKSAIFIFPLMTLHVFCTQMSCVMCNFTFTLLDELSACIVSYWYTSRIACMCKNDLVSLASHTKLPSPCILCVNAIRKHMFHTCHSKGISICLEWYSGGVTHIVFSHIFYVIFHLENFQVVTIGVLCLLMQCK
jgi:hypothetical protein